MALSGLSISISKGHIHPVPQPPASSRSTLQAPSVMSYLSTPLPRDPVPWPLWSATPSRPLTHRHQSDDFVVGCRLLYRWRHSYSHTLTLARPSPVLVPCVPTLMCFHLCLALSHPRYATAFSCFELSYLLNSNSSITTRAFPVGLLGCSPFYMSILHTLSLNTPKKHTSFTFTFYFYFYFYLFIKCAPKILFPTLYILTMHPILPPPCRPYLIPSTHSFTIHLSVRLPVISCPTLSPTRMSFVLRLFFHTDEPRATLLQWITIMAIACELNHRTIL
ncbi:hypothetical protein EDB83DRAFT_262111 [Lactarius deliciosus]|nr:hypothetical protein EDB83DRAFT_262111 [Lactarius deliciosus]